MAANFFDIPGYNPESGLAPPVDQKPSNAQKKKSGKRGEIKGGILGLFESIGGFQPGMEQVQAGLHAAGRGIGGAASGAVDMLREAGINNPNVTRGFGNIVANNPNFIGGEDDGEPDPGSPTARHTPPPSPEAIERWRLKAADASFEHVEDVGVLEQENMSPEARAIYEKWKSEREAELANINNELADLEAQGAFLHENLSEATEAAFPEGLIPGADPEATAQLNELLDEVGVGGTGGSAPELQAVIDSIVDSNLPEHEKLERLGMITSQAEMRNEVQGAIDSLVTDREATQKLLDLPPSVVIADPEQFAQPKLNVDVQFSPEGRTTVAVIEEVEGMLEQEFGGQIPAEVLDSLSNAEGSGIIDLVALGQLDPNSEEFIRRVGQEVPGVPAASIQSAVNQGLETAAIRHEAWDTALDQTQYRAGSPELVYALFKAAMGTGMFDEQTAGQIAEDENIHHIIDVYSNGQVGAQGTGGRQGLGMLTPEAYERLNIPMDGTAESELMAIVMYMMEPGNPAIRLQTFFDTGVSVAHGRS